MVVSLTEMREMVKREIQLHLSQAHILMEQSVEKDILNEIDSLTKYYFILSNHHQFLYTSGNMNE